MLIVGPLQRRHIEGRLLFGSQLGSLRLLKCLESSWEELLEFLRQSFRSGQFGLTHAETNRHLPRRGDFPH